MRLKSMGFISVLVLVAAACGGGTDVTDAPGTTASAGGTETSSAPSDQSSPDSPPEASAPSGSGEFTVDGQSFQVTQVARCDPYDPNDENNPDDLDVVASSAEGVHLSLTISHGDSYAVSDDGGYVISDSGVPVTYSAAYHDLRINRFADGAQEQYASSASHDVDNVWYMNYNPIISAPEDGDMLDGPPFIRSGDSISGGMTIVKDYPAEDGTTLDVTFNFDFPSDITGC